MRSLFYSLLSLATVATTIAADTTTSKAGDDWDDDVVPDTIFNGQTVPPMKEMRPDTFKADIDKGNWYE
jgi:protein disulfide-isomerase